MDRKPSPFTPPDPPDPPGPPIHPPYRPPRSPVFNAPRVVIWLIGALVLAHLARVVVPLPTAAPVLVYLPFASQDLALFSEFPVLIATRWVGHAFMHQDWLHLLVNCGFLLAFGTPVARQAPMFSFLILFAAGAAAGAGLTLAISGDQAFVLIGASGGVSAMLGALSRMMVLRRAGEIPPRPFNSVRSGAILIGVFLVVNLLIGFVPGPGGATISGSSHIGGFLAGFALSLILPWRRFGKGVPAND
jgi:membrane associated rhomboid family serine protease